MTEQNKSIPISQEAILRVLEQIKVDINKLSVQVKQIKAKDEVEAFFEIPEIQSE